MDRQSYLDEAERNHRDAVTLAEDLRVPRELSAIYNVLRALAEPEPPKETPARPMSVDEMDSKLDRRPVKSSRDYMQDIADAMNAAEAAGLYVRGWIAHGESAEQQLKV